MNQKILTSIGVLLIAFTSCVKNPDVDTSKGLDLSFSFQTRSEIQVEITAVNELGLPGSGVLFSIYTENPSSSNLSPIYQGYTGSNGEKTLSLAVPNNADSLFIIPNYSGYGSMQSVKKTDNSSVLLKGKQQNIKAETKTLTQAVDIERNRVNCGVNYYSYRYLTPGTDYDPDYGELLPSELVSFETLSDSFKELVNEWFSDTHTTFDYTINNDIVVTEDGTNVWMTYIGDGGYTSSIGTQTAYNSILYYTYPEGMEMPDFGRNGEVSVNDFLKSSTSHNITYAIINANPNHTACGTKVQLLFWNGSEYVSEFPAGTRIGIAFAYNGYKKSDGTRNFNIKSAYYRFSTPQMNSDKDSHGIIVESKDYNCFIVGIDYGGANGVQDKDFNDALVKITSSKPITTVNVQKVNTGNVEIHSTCEGTLAFEDLWPYTGDYDFNDFVTDYRYDLYKIKGTNKISDIEMTFVAKAVGAGNNNGFGVELPFPPSSITVDGAVLEDGGSKASMIVLSNVRSVFPGAEGFINTFAHIAEIKADTVKVKVHLSAPVEETAVPFSSINPFLFAGDNRGREIHLVDHAPTSHSNMALLGTGFDKSDTEKGIYYRMDNKFPWALDIAGNGLASWRYPQEMVNIAEAYTHYSEWAEDHSISWFDWTVSGNINENKLYPIAK